MPDLKKCPKCGGEAEVGYLFDPIAHIKVWAGRCRDRKCSWHRSSLWNPSPSFAADIWNEKVVEELEERLEIERAQVLNKVADIVRGGKYDHLSRAEIRALCPMPESRE